MVEQRSDPWIDEARLEMLIDVGHGAEFVSSLVRRFGDAGEKLIGRLPETLAVGDFDRTRDTVHALKGSASELGATSLAGLCLGIERMSDEELLHRDASRLVTELSESLERTQFAIARFLERRTDAGTR